jgi:hypothetical protein
VPKYQCPAFLTLQVSSTKYTRWLHGKAAAHVRRDKKRGNPNATVPIYQLAIHQAVLDSGGRDHYTGELLDWSLISSYDNAQSKAGRRTYKAGFALLPTIDHVGNGLGKADFKVCAWRTNDAKSDLAHDEFVALCRRVVAHHDRIE